MVDYKLKVKKPPLVCLILLISFPSLVGVLISPALPAISDHFNATDAQTQNLIILFILGYALGQLLYSPFANRYGRKIAIYVGLGLYFFSLALSFIAIYTQSLSLLSLSRFLAALGSCVGMVITFTIINDFYYPKEARQTTSYTMLAFAFMPGLAVSVGGLITTYLTWIDCFYFFVLYGLFMIYITTRLPETLLDKNNDALKVKRLLFTFLESFKNKRILTFSLSYGLMASYIYIVATAAPFVGIDIIHLKASTYGLLILIPYFGQFIGAIFSGRLSHLISAYQAIGWAYGSMVIGSLLMLIAFKFGMVNVWTLFIPIFFIMLGIPLSNSSLTVMALLDSTDKATGSAVMSFITMMVAFAFTIFLTLSSQNDLLMMPILFTVIIVLALILYFISKKVYPE